MKRQYWFIILFVVWCSGGAWWYLFGVKGVKTDPQFFNAQATTISIIEILIMLLVACLIGYAIAWSIRQEAIEDQERSTQKLAAESNSLARANSEIKSQLDLWKSKYQQDLGYSQQKLNDAIIERDKVQRQFSELESSIWSKQQESLSSQTQIQQLETETGTLKYRIRQLEFQNKEHEEAYGKLKQELEALQVSKKEKPGFSDHPFVRPVEPDEKDDLTSIKGIAPFIEKRLNMLGIYTFKQLSELTPELVERVGNAIEFFPGRIERENWIGQARNFVNS